MLDVVIVGGGPAALAAALYLARAGLTTKVIEKAVFGGTLPVIAQLENYPGFRGEGKVLAERMLEQARLAGAEVVYGECMGITKVNAVKSDVTESGAAKSSDEVFRIVTDEGVIEARSVLIASGSAPKSLAFTPEIPVSYCALCDGALTKGKNVVVVGGANSAVQEAIYLAHLAQKVTIVTHSQLKADQSLLAQLSTLSNLEIREQTEPTAELINQFDYCFVYIGRAPATEFLGRASFDVGSDAGSDAGLGVNPDLSLLDEQKYVITGKNAAFPHQTALPGLFAAGDVRQGSTKQAVTAAAEGAIAAIEITNYLRNLANTRK